MKTPRFKPGKNIAMKIPGPEFEATVAFYRDTLGLSQIQTEPESVVFEFGGKNLWLDRVDHISRAEIWLEIIADCIDLAAAHFETSGVIRRDGIEKLPDGFEGFWISNPARIIHLVSHD